MRTPLGNGKRIVLTEGVADEEDILPSAFKSGQAYAKLAGALGLDPQPQNTSTKQGRKSQAAPVESSREPRKESAPAVLPGVTFKNADIDISALDEKHREVLVAILEMLDTDNIAELLVAQPEGVTGRDIELLLFDGLLAQRNDSLMRHFEESAPGHTEVFIPWGAAHLPDIEQRLLSRGYTQQNETVRPIVRFWDNQ